MATTRATGYVVTAAVWNAVLSGLSDAGVFTGTITTSGTATFNGGFAVQNTSDVPRFYTPSSGVGIRVVGRSSDSIGGLQFMDTSQATEYLVISARSTGTFLDTGSTSRTFTFGGGRVNTNTVQPGFLAYNSANDTGVASGTDIDFDTEIYDTASNFASDTFTAPVTGRYLLSASVLVSNVSGGALDIGAYIRTSNLPGGFWIGYQTGVPNSSQRLFSGSAIVDMDASDTATVRLDSTGSVTIHGDGTGLALTYFCGRLLV